MAAPQGNHNAVGNRGGGRKSAYQEGSDAALLREMFLTPMSREEVQAKLKSGKYSLKDLFVSKGYAGNERVLLALFNKNFPDDLLTMEQKNTNAEGGGLTVEAVKSIDDVRALIEETINGVRSGSMSVQAAANVGRLASLALKAIEVGELDKKMDLVNSVINDRKMNQKNQKK
jgi:hypothetical protein